MQSELNVFVELADTWETIEGNSDQRAIYRECADGLRMMVDFKRQQIDTSLQPDRAPTHRCTVCGAFWMKWKDGWSLCSKQCGQCCDNVAMGDQIVPLIVSDIYAPAAEITHLTEALRAAEEREKGLREALVKADEPHWFYAEGYEDRCLYSPDDAIDLLDFDAGEYVTEVATARPCRSIWCAVRVTDDEDADERFTFTEHDSEESARAALKGPSHDA